MTGGWEVTLQGVIQRFGRTTALDGVDVAFRPGVITGLIGRNGAGKTTLLQAVAALRPVTEGQVLVDGAPVWEDAARTSRVCLLGHTGGVLEDVRIAATLDLYRMLRPDWDEAAFRRVVDRLEVPLDGRPSRLSTGQRSAFAAALALASRAEVTLLDEVHIGLDAVARRRLTEAILEEYAERPRTIVLSSHLLDEVEEVMEDVVVLHEGRVVAAGPAGELREEHTRGGGRPASLTDVLENLSGGAS